MKQEEQIKALAELDGWIKEDPNLPQNPEHYRKDFSDRIRVVDDIKKLSSYLTSYDAIIPLIQKQIKDAGDAVCFMNEMNAIGHNWTPSESFNMVKILTANPSQLSEALLRATGKWKD